MEISVTRCRFLFLSLLSYHSIAAQISPGEQATNIQVSNIVFPSKDDVRDAIRLAAGYLERSCGPDGRFAYRIDNTSGRDVGGYNVIRHAGAIYALAMLNRLQPSSRGLAATLRAAAFLRRTYVGVGVHPDELAVWSEPLSEREHSRYPVAELGATGLGLVALAAVDESAPESVPIGQLQALGRFILFLQRGNGSFVSKFVANKGEVPNWQSLYYPGEAALGLLSLYEADHNRRWLMAAAAALAHLAESRAGMNNVPADHWALIATAQFFRLGGRPDAAVSREQLIHHANLDGAFDWPGRTTPAATRLEGLMAALEFLPKGDLTIQIEAAVRRGIAFLLRAQIVTGPYAGGVPETIFLDPGHTSVIRIDYVQHAVCAWLRYLELLGGRDLN
jgi:hypothetical protein